MSGIRLVKLMNFCDRILSKIIRRNNNISITEPTHNTKILMFHDISDNIETYTMSEKRFEFVIKKCLEEGYTFISLDELISNKNSELGKIVVTFDDGFKSLYTTALPILEKYDIPFAVYITTEFVDKEYYLSREEIKLLSCNNLCTIGSHLQHHVMTRTLDREHIKGEIRNSCSALSHCVGLEIKHVALPYGSITACSTMDCRIIKKLGVKSLALTTPRCVTAKDIKNPFFLPRLDACSNRVLG